MSSLKDFVTARERRDHLQKKLSLSFSTIGASLSDSEDDVHCENLIGATTVPLGVAGPVSVIRQSSTSEHFIPLATTEGALVASVARGAKATSAAGGINVYVNEVGVTRGPVFFTGSVGSSEQLAQWIRTHEEILRKEAEKTSSHLTYLSCSVKKISSHVFVRFHYETGEAMGMNMVTIATQAIVERIEKETGYTCVSVAGNYDVDKKPSWLNFIEGRGTAASAEAIIPASVVVDTLKTTSTRLYETWFSKCILGSIASGSMGYNAHFSNIVVAMYIALGQDPAHAVEGSLGITTTKVLPNGDLHVAVEMPSIMVGTVGGGTALRTQKEAQDLAGVKSKLDLACLVAASTLCGELSLLASLSEGSLARAHKKLGRK